MNIIQQKCVIAHHDLLYQGTLVVVGATIYLTGVRKEGTVKVLDQRKEIPSVITTPWDIKVYTMLQLTDEESSVYILGDIMKVRQSFHDMLQKHFPLKQYLFSCAAVVREDTK